MSTDQPTPGPDDPRPHEPRDGEPRPGEPRPEEPRPEEPRPEQPEGDRFAGRQPPPSYGSPYGGTYGGEHGAADPLAGMPPLANRGRRLVARIVDALIIGIPVGLVMAVLVGDYDPVNNNNEATAMTIVYALVYFVYEGLMLTKYGQTVGKKVMRIRVAMLENGEIPAGQPGWLRAGTYALPEIVPCCGFIFWLVNVLWCTWDRPFHQCLHDKVAKTVVVSVPS
ncbi:RDD family protein [Streptomyces sparsogenes]|uniref:Putative integral membrane protein n=1 Tax=Streptomyces sparsogenes DSM 40356 TaxID=1331668 RepID=A0A1R1S697_9ACTN|nr:RDD family protein [Streptomyces sparsogenes]OMI33808.1 putative integral membrane protein [Streptomyces sparsogenes DSM 40356]